MTKKTLRSAADLLQAGLINAENATDIAAVAEKYAIAISPHLQNMLQHPGISKQFVPSAAELINTNVDLKDPIGDQTHSPIKGIIHRYPDRCLLQPVRVCPVYCRFCFRRETVGPGNAALTPLELQKCYEYIKNNSQIWEVILSGGDPLILKNPQLSDIITKLNAIDHVEIIRIHTRVPIVDPDRIDQTLINVLKQHNPVYVVLHVNHAAEFSAAAIRAIAQLVDNGIVLLGQTVLLKDVNDDIDSLGQLMRTMIKHRVKPYYLHHPDLASGTAHFRTSIAQGQQLITKLRGNYSGLCQPEYVLDIPGGAGKSPIGPSYLSAKDDHYEVVDFNGKIHLYKDRSDVT